jgi:hypothetical protein
MRPPPTRKAPALAQLTWISVGARDLYRCLAHPTESFVNVAIVKHGRARCRIKG